MNPRIKQVKKKNSPTLSRDTKKMMELNKKNLTKAIQSQEKKDWIEYRRICNIISNMVSTDKKNRLEKTS